jgi:myo-inositol-1(or 4)-monophosphatase
MIIYRNDFNILSIILIEISCKISLLSFYISSIPAFSSRNLQSFKPVASSSLFNNNIQKYIQSNHLFEEEELDKFLSVAIDASKKAGNIILDYKNGVEVSDIKANNRDLLTLVDPLCESVIQNIIKDSFPHHDFLGEEDVSPGAEASASKLNSFLIENDSNSKYLWIVDPIDGTSNFVHGMPLCMPSVALAYEGEVIIGVIHDPHRNETFYAKKGYGSYMNGNSIKVSKEDRISDAIISMGSPPAVQSMRMSLIGIQALMPKCRTIRMLGSAALMLAWVACGRLTSYWEYDLSSWDVAAGALIIREAGGKFTNLLSEDWKLIDRKICASNGLVHSEIINTLNEVGVC